MKRPIIERSDDINYTALNLPAMEMEYGVVEAAKANNVVIVSGGIRFRKSTQIPKVSNFYHKLLLYSLCNIEINDCEFSKIFK